MYRWKFPEIQDSLAIQPESNNIVFDNREQELPCLFDVSSLAAESIGVAAHNISSLTAQDEQIGGVHIDRRMASFWFDWSIRPIGWSLPSPWDEIAGDYRCTDGWIRLHTNHHRAPAIEVLGCEETREDVAAKVADWRGDQLEQAIVDAGGCAGYMRSLKQWQAHEQGQAVAKERLAHFESIDHVSATEHRGTVIRPLQGIRILDLTRVLAGPVAGRFLAAYGAEVLRIDPPWWEEPGVIPEVTLGKRCAGLDLHKREDRVIFEALLSETDVLLHGYRPGALEALGYDSDSLRQFKPDLIDASLDAYGWSGPWAERRGFDSLVQMSSGIADYIKHQEVLDKPGKLPVQALDHATGYFLAAAVIKTLHERMHSGHIQSAKLSLARCADLLIGSKRDANAVQPCFDRECEADLSLTLETTSWGDARRIDFPAQINGIETAFDHPATQIRSTSPQWLKP